MSTVRKKKEQIENKTARQHNKNKTQISQKNLKQIIFMQGNIMARDVTITISIHSTATNSCVTKLSYKLQQACTSLITFITHNPHLQLSYTIRGEV